MLRLAAGFPVPQQDGPETPGSLQLLGWTCCINLLSVSRDAETNIDFQHCQRFETVGYGLFWADPTFFKKKKKNWFKLPKCFGFFFSV